MTRGSWACRLLSLIIARRPECGTLAGAHRAFAPRPAAPAPPAAAARPRHAGAVASPAMWRRLGRALVGTVWYDLPMPHTAELLLADLDPTQRQRIWKAAAGHATQTAPRIEAAVQIILINAIYLIVFVPALRERIPLPP